MSSPLDFVKEHGAILKSGFEPEPLDKEWEVLVNETLPSINPASWMGDARPWLKDIPLGQIMLPGSHDAGMYIANDLTYAATAGNTVTQLHPIRDQLDLGVRLFDIRPVLDKNNKLVCGHVSYVNDYFKWQGGFGESIQDVVRAINDFTAKHIGECVIVHVHDFCGFQASNNFNGFSEADWRTVYDELDQLNNLFQAPAGQEMRWLPWYTWKELVPDSESTVIVVMSKGEEYMYGKHAKGFYKSQQW